MLLLLLLLLQAVVGTSSSNNKIVQPENKRERDCRTHVPDMLHHDFSLKPAVTAVNHVGHDQANRRPAPPHHTHPLTASSMSTISPLSASAPASISRKRRTYVAASARSPALTAARTPWMARGGMKKVP